jgi:hypothetical protein
VTTAWSEGFNAQATLDVPLGQLETVTVRVLPLVGDQAVLHQAAIVSPSIVSWEVVALPQHGVGGLVFKV